MQLDLMVMQMKRVWGVEKERKGSANGGNVRFSDIQEPPASGRDVKTETEALV